MSLMTRIVRAAKLDPTLYEEVEADRGAMGQALTVVLLSGLAAGLGAVSMGGLPALVIGTAGAVGGWFVWALLTYLIGAKLFPEPQTKADMGEMLRTIGFASAPGLVRVFGAIPGLRDGIFFAAAVWMLIAMVVAVRQALDYQSTSRAVGVCLLGWLIQIVLFLVLLRVQGIDPTTVVR
ncbi:MAG: YIP1 family protein [Nitrospiria bacterium]